MFYGNNQIFLTNTTFKMAHDKEKEALKVISINV